MILDIPDRSYGGFIFDCDGTLVNSMPIHYLAWSDALSSHDAGFVFEETLFYEWGGIPPVNIVSMLNDQHGTDLDPEGVTRSKYESYFRRLGTVEEIPAVAAIARKSHGEIPMSVASGGSEPSVRKALEVTGLLSMFEIIITPVDVERPKPAPDMFILAAERMGVDPEDCLVFEDGPVGIEGARAAGMDTVFIPRVEA